MMSDAGRMRKSRDESLEGLKDVPENQRTWVLKTGFVTQTHALPVLHIRK